MVEYFITFLEGSITFISPCMLPMLPIYLSYFAGGDQKRGALQNSLCFVIGFTAVFLAMGAFAGTLGSILKGHSGAVNLVGGGLMILFGLQTMGLLHIPIFKGISGLSHGAGAPGVLHLYFLAWCSPLAGRLA
jgi:cytochrome c-type biogenesis protein